VEFKFAHSLTDDAYRFVVWREGSLEMVALPPVGESITVN
jgi:hypothetical protein